jgi:integrase
VYRTRFNEAWDSALVKAGIRPADRAGRPEPGNCHVLPHTAASAWLSAGVSVAAVAAWLGDTPQTVLATYAHLMPSDRGAARRAVDAFFSASARLCPWRVGSDAPPQVSPLRSYSSVE